MDSPILIAGLDEFWRKHMRWSKRILSLALVINRSAAEKAPPYSLDQFLAPGSRYVKELTLRSVKAILSDHGITLTLSNVKGKISATGVEWLTAYIDLLNGFHEEEIFDFKLIEGWWIELILKYFDSIALKLRLDQSRSLNWSFCLLFEKVRTFKRGFLRIGYVSRFMEHLVEAMLRVSSHKFQYREETGHRTNSFGERGGSFIVGDMCIHVTDLPTQSLIQTCRENLSQNLKPVIITSQVGLSAVSLYTTGCEIRNNIDTYEIIQFLVSGIYMHSGFKQDECTLRLRIFLDIFNGIIDQTETDPSLKITLV